MLCNGLVCARSGPQTGSYSGSWPGLQCGEPATDLSLLLSPSDTYLFSYAIRLLALLALPAASAASDASVHAADTCDGRSCGSAATPSPLHRTRAPPGGRCPRAPAKMRGLFMVRAHCPSCTSGPDRHCAGRQARSPPSLAPTSRITAPGTQDLGVRGRGGDAVDGRSAARAGGSPLPGTVGPNIP